jgi:hypothetical protein
MSKPFLTAVLWGMGAVASAAPLPGFVLAGQTAHFSFFSRGERIETAKVERRVSELEKIFGAPLARHANYYRYASAQEVAAGTGFYASGVTFAQTAEVHSSEAFHDHELVHLVAGQLGAPGAFFEEGLAVAVGDRGQVNGHSADKAARPYAGRILQIAAGFDGTEPAVGYAVAGSFVGYLVRTHGMASVTAFFRACGPGVDPAAAFADAFGGTMQALTAQWRGTL